MVYKYTLILLLFATDGEEINHLSELILMRLYSLHLWAKPKESSVKKIYIYIIITGNRGT